MKKNLPLYLLGVLLILCTSGKPGWTPLFNGENLDNWVTHIGTPLTGFEDLHKTATTDKVFSVVEQDGEKVIRISGEVNGALATKETFENYHLQLVFKWGDKVYTRQNSGLLYHSNGEFGEALGTWMTCIEHQLLHSCVGDTYLMNTSNCETSAAKQQDDTFIYTPGVAPLAFGTESNGRKIQKAADFEKPVGEWNTIDLYCFGRTSVHVVNGHTVMVNNNCGVYTGHGIKPVSSGKIQLQSEGAELFIKSIKISPIKKLPKKILN